MDQISEPGEAQKAIIKDIAYWRGGILTAYSQVEFLLADISVKLDLRFASRIKDRIKAVERIAERPGFEAYKDELAKVCTELLEYDDIRTFMAHAYVMVLYDKRGNHSLEFRLYQRGRGEIPAKADDRRPRLPEACRRADYPVRQSRRTAVPPDLHGEEVRGTPLRPRGPACENGKVVVKKQAKGNERATDGNEHHGYPNWHEKDREFLLVPLKLLQILDELIRRRRRDQE